MELDEYRRIAEAETSHWWYASTRRLLADLLGPHLVPGGRYLDAGCGPGATGAWMAAHGAVVGLDAEALALRLLGEHHPPVAERGPVGLVGDVARLPFPDASFDAVLCVTVLYHAAVASPSAVVGELARVLRPGGVLCLMEPGVRRLRRAHDRATHGARRFSLGDLRRLLVDNGLTVERATGAYSFLVPVAAAKAVLERGRSSSDLGADAGALAGPLGAVAGVERAFVRRVALPFGLSVAVLGRKRRQ